ncbi:MAG TPA: ABC transporter ATP-binding protein [Actinomycetales bacterium]|nr:ABC transporter ATP-binding protein [Actinomycetales bacterium]
MSATTSPDSAETRRASAVGAAVRRAAEAELSSPARPLSRSAASGAQSTEAAYVTGATPESAAGTADARRRSRHAHREEPQTKELKLRVLFRRFWPFAAPRKKWLTVAFLLAAAGPAMTTASILMLKVVVDDILVPRRFDLFIWVALIYVGLTVVENAVSGTDRMLSTWLSQRFLVDLRLHVIRHLQTLSPEFFSRSRLGDVLSRLSGDVAAIEGFIVSGTTDLVYKVLQLVFFCGALFFLQWQLALVSLIICPLFWLTARYFSRRIKEISREKQRRSGAIASVAEQILSNISLVQAYGRSEHETERFHQEVEGKYRAEMRSAKLRCVYSPVVDLIEVAGLLMVLGAGAWLVSQNALTVGGLLAFLALLSQLYSPVRGLGSLLNAAYSASAGAERVLEVLDERPGVEDRPDAVALGRVQGRLELDSVRFSYPDRPQPALDDVSFTVAPGDVVALVGASGAGKSTIVKLLLRFYDADAGSVRLDGHDVRDVTLESLRANIAVLLQETLVLDGTVRDNIAYGLPGATDAQIEQAAREADAHNFIVALPDGYDSRIGERGRRLSGGQCQRLAIARAMLRNAPVLVLDEPTTGLDAGSADRILEPLRRLMAGRATIIVSHNLATVREATQILVLDHGRVIERGTHVELLRRGGRYRELWRLAGMGQQNAGARVLRGDFARGRTATVRPDSAPEASEASAATSANAPTDGPVAPTPLRPAR